MEAKSSRVDKVKSCTTTFEWKIEGFDRQLEPIPYSNPNFYERNTKFQHTWGKGAVSDSFMAGQNIGIKSLWHLEFETTGAQIFDGKLMEFAQRKFTLIFENCIGTGNEIEEVTPFSCHARLSILHPQTFVLMHKFSPACKGIDVRTNGERHEFEITRHDVLEAMVENTVCISVELEIFENGSSVGISGSVGREFGITNLQKDFEKLLGDEDSFDFTIDCDGRIFIAHKLILRARSTVFAAMLNNKDFKESQTSTLVVEDIDKPTMEILLHYIYTGKLLTELMKSLNVLEPVIHAADKYDLSELKNHCFYQLAQSITVDNFGPLVVLAHAVRTEKRNMLILKNYYLRNVLSLMKNTGFRNLAARHPEIIFDD